MDSLLFWDMHSNSDSVTICIQYSRAIVTKFYRLEAVVSKCAHLSFSFTSGQLNLDKSREFVCEITHETGSLHLWVLADQPFS